VKGERLKILYAEPVPGSGAPGEVISDDLTIACCQGALRLVKVQRAGGKVMEAGELLKGFSVPPGTKFY
jgi:methionyl-tRNA formyltransferase